MRHERIAAEPAGSGLGQPVTGADLLAAQLAAAGATHAFGIPGGEVLALVDALGRASIRFELARHENAAGFMAEGLWHATGALPVLVATLGPGVANAVNVVANAQQDRVPLIFVTGCVDQALAESYTHQVFDHQAVLRPLVKASFRIAPGTEDLVVAKAAATARRGRPGPVHIDLPISVAEARTVWRVAPALTSAVSAIPADLRPAQALIAAAQRPLVIAGLDLVEQRGGAALDRFLAATGAPLLTTYKAKGLVPEDDPRVIGAVGLSPRADAIVQPLIEAADLIVLAGYDPIEMRQGWRNPWPAGKPVIDIVAEPVQHGMHHSSLLLEGDVGTILTRLTDGLSAKATWLGGEPAAIRGAFRAAFTAPAEWGPHAVFETLRKIAPAGTVATADSGAHRILLSQIWNCDGPRTLLQSSGLCTMGCALPLATGAAFGSGRPTLCFVGDAGLEMVLGELATLRDLNLPVIVVVLVDRALGLIALKQRQLGLARSGVDIGETDFAGIARAIGGHGATIEDRETLAREAEAAFRRDGFTLLACRIDAGSYEGAF
ncbi:Acetolactate synthase-1/2/3 large subunit [Bosea sp. 62]|uniref:thiamine pyrophosphate-binding protein n=1 Tax=unclassified Bosea (in: a-proteobacteria) TaxID=2653178 RepID=UPI00125874B9|nr:MULTISPECIES: thiamine pyrophosphate-binding protein [unclassified Bosea (in: a-proteobacteria)]CAD5296818.1 Acetolactate synthase-1/2/3 large subunit [Bosea sp. 7B]CAD5296996.1 Acetolactate synthase-1/2/3 large subunit [Bosea sp. 21B]CAD5297278.1 Acetolactate synthase-1/2/3 large subunit [Bosea sp. 46]VVT61219.1 Acetolactate synthase-1/2/3 large subunit [Bosea sp. EC-HK365B]VXB19985.1 Acetolactate synthase-1/2/3 large subunit [Bosea sp. 125]